MNTFAILVTLVMFVSVMEFGHTQGEPILPEAFCSYLSYRFRKEGCLKEGTLFCRVLALQLNANFRGQFFCPQFTCEGFTSRGHQCKGFLSCPFGRIRTKGICPLSKVCCANPA